MVSAAGAVKATRLTDRKPETPATLSAPARVQVNGQIPVTWNGQNRPGDSITITQVDAFANASSSRAFASFGNPATLVAPDKPGTYVIRYVSGRTIRVLGERRITVYDYKATVAGPGSVEIGKTFAVRWTGPANKGDYIIVARKDGGRFAYGSSAAADGDRTVKLSAALVPGTYEIRYMVNHPRRRILARQSLIVTDAAVTLSAPKTVRAGGNIVVRWTGPRLRAGLIGFAPVKSPDRSYVFGSYKGSVNAAQPLTLRAPKKAGVYEIRYRLRNGLKHRVLARVQVTVTD